MKAMYFTALVLSLVFVASFQQVIPGVEPLTNQESLCFASQMSIPELDFERICSGVDFVALGNSSFSSLCSNLPCLEIVVTIITSCGRNDYAVALRDDVCNAVSIPGLGLISNEQGQCLGRQIFVNGSESSGQSTAFIENCSAVDRNRLLEQGNISLSCSQQSCFSFFRSAFVFCNINNGRETVDSLCGVFVIPGLGSISAEQGGCLGRQVFVNGSESSGQSVAFIESCSAVDRNRLLEESDLSLTCSQQSCSSFFRSALSICNVDGGREFVDSICGVFVIPGLGPISAEQGGCLGRQIFVNGSESSGQSTAFIESCSALDRNRLLEESDISLTCSQQSCFSFFQNAFSFCDVAGGREFVDSLCGVLLIPGLDPISPEQVECLGRQLFTDGLESAAFASSCSNVNRTAITDQRDLSLTCSQLSCINFFREAFATCNVADGGSLLDSVCVVIVGLGPLSLLPPEQSQCFFSRFEGQPAFSENCNQQNIQELSTQRDVSLACDQPTCADFLRSAFLVCGIRDGVKLVESECEFECNDSMKIITAPLIIVVSTISSFMMCYIN